MSSSWSTGSPFTVGHYIWFYTKYRLNRQVCTSYMLSRAAVDSVGSNAKWRFVWMQLAAKLKIYEFNDLFSRLCKHTRSILQN